MLSYFEGGHPPVITPSVAENALVLARVGHDVGDGWFEPILPVAVVSAASVRTCWDDSPFSTLRGY